MKKMFLAGASLLVLSAITPAFTNDADKVVSATGNLLIDSTNKTGFFQWIRGGVGYTDKNLNFDITAFSNLSETKDTVTYLQTSYNRQKSTNRLNLGLGYRKLIDTTSTPLIVGVNAFFDTKDGTKNILALKSSENFQRYSIGAELKTARFDLSTNLYRPIGNNIIDDKKVLRGWDITAKGNIPNYDQVSVGVGAYTFDGVEDTVVKGNKLIAEFRPNPTVTIRGEYDKPSGESAQTNISVDFKWAFGKPIQDQMKSAPVPSAGTVWHKRYDKVERQHDIKTAEVETTPTLPIVSSGAISSNSDNTIASGDGKTEATAFVLPDNNKFEIKKFINAPTGAVKAELNSRTAINSRTATTPTVAVTVEVMGSGTLGTEFAFEDSAGNPIDNIKNVDYESVLVDKAGSNTAVLKLSYQVSGYAQQDVFVKTTESFTGTVTMGDLVVPYASGDKTVTAADILAKLTVSGGQTKASEWTVKSLANTDSNTNLAVGSGGKTLIISGAITTKTTVTIGLAHPAYADQTKTFELSTGAGTLGSATHTGSGKWGQTYTTDYKLKTSDTVGDVTVPFDTNADYTFSVVAPATTVSGFTSTTTGIVQGALSGAINANTGAIDGTKLTKSGTLLVKIVRKAKGGLPQITDYANLPVAKQTAADHTGFTVSAGDITWNTNSQTVTYTEANKPVGIGTATYTLTTAGTTAGTAITVASGDGKIAKTAQSGVVKVKVIYAANDKYAQMSRDVDVAVNKRVVMSLLTPAKMIVPYVSGTKALSTTYVMDKLFTSGSGKSDWNIKSLADTGAAGTGKLTISADKKSMTVIGAVATPITITVVLESPKYADVTRTFALSTRATQVIDGSPTGLSGKWGKGTVTPNYKLDLDDQGQTFNAATDYTFSVVSSSDGSKGGKDATTAGIFTSNPISNSKTGVIDTSKLIKSGKLLIKIVRAAKGSGANAVPEATDYVNFDVTKQDSSDHPNFTVSAGAIPWATASRPITYTEANKPTGIGTATYTLTAAGTTAGPTTGGNAITVASSDGKIAKTTQSGSVKVRITYAATDKYAQMSRDVDVTINKQTLPANTLSVANLTVVYASGNKKVNAVDVLTQLTTTGSNKSDWTVKSLADTDSHGNLAVANDGKSMTISGAIASGTTVTVVFESTKYADVTKTFELSTNPSQISSATRTGSGKWGKTYTTTYNLKTRDGGQDFTTGARGDFTFSIVAAGGDDGSGMTQTTTGIIDTSKTAINSKTGAINGVALTKSGTLLVKIVRVGKGTGVNAVPQATEYQNFTVSKQDLASDISKPTFTSINPKWGSKIPVTFAGIPTGTTFANYDWTAAPKTGGVPTGTLGVVSDGITGATSAGTVVVTMKAKANNDKYEGQVDLADFAITKQTVASGTLSVSDLVVMYTSGDKTVSATDVLGQLTPTGSRRSDWTVKSLTDTDGNGNLAVADNRKSMTISGTITSGTTVTVVFESTKYTDVTKTFKLSTKQSQISSDTRTGSGKWGSGQTYTTDYKLKGFDGGQRFTTGKRGHFTFSIVPSQSGFTSTTAGIVANGQTAIDSKTGDIDASKLTKSGTLLVKIVRAAKGPVPETTDYENFTVSKQDSSDHSGFAVTAGAITWNANSQTVTYNDSTNKPAGISNPTYALTAVGTTAGPTTGGNAITVASSDGKIAKTTQSGVVKVKVTYPANDKYETIIRNVDVTVNEQAIAGSMADLVIPYSGGNDPVSSATILGKFTPPTGSNINDWTIKSLTETHRNILVVTDTATGAKSLSITGAINTPTTVTVVFEDKNNKYADVTTTFKLSTKTGTISSGTRTGLTGTWGKTFVATDYKLKPSDTVGDTTVTFGDLGDYFFSILPNWRGDDGSGLTPTTAGIVASGKTAINRNTGAIDGTKLTKSGTLLVQIVRKQKGGLPAITDYQSITVHKQVLGTDVTTVPTISLASGDNAWKANAADKFNMAYTNLPDNRAANTFAWTVAGKQNAAPSGTLEIDDDGKVSGATSPGTVVITMGVKADDAKYSGSMTLADFAIAKRTVAASTLSMADLVVSFLSGTKTVSAADILRQLTPTGSNRSDWTVKSLSKKDANSNFDIDRGGKSLTIKGEFTTSTTVTVEFESTKYTDVTKDFELSTRPAQVIDGSPTGLSSKWGKGTVTPDYMLKLKDQGQTFDKATDYTFSVVPNSDGGKGGKDATTAGIFTSDPISNSKTGVIDTGKLTKSGKLLIKIVRVAKTGANPVAEATEYVNFDVQKQVLGTDVVTAPAVAKATNEDGKWKDSTSAKINLNYTLPGSTTESDYTWAVAKKSSDAPDGTLSADANGHISGATSGGTAQITITAKDSNPQYTGTMRTADFTIAKQILGTDVTTRPAVAIATGEDGKWKDSTSAKIVLNYALPGGTTATQYTWAVGKKSGAEPDGTLVIDDNGHISGATSSGTAEITMTAKGANKKYSGNIRTADFAIKKQTVGANTLTVTNLAVVYTSGNKMVSATNVLGQLTTTGSAKKDWTVKSLTDTDNHGKLAVASGGKALTISGDITNGTTVTVVFESSKYMDVTKTFELSTQAEQVIDGTPTGLSGKWGKSTVTPDYKLKAKDQGYTFDKATDYTFSIVPNSDGGRGGKDATTAGIIASGQNAMHNSKTGVIDTSKLTKTGKLLIKIVRAAKTGANPVAEATEYVNFDVNKQVLGTDITTPPAVATATNEDGKWKSDTNAKIALNYTLPGGTTASQYTWGISSATSGGARGALAIDANGHISKAISGGKAEITITAKSDNPKYSGTMRTADFTIVKQVLGTDVNTSPAVAKATGEDGKWKTSTSAKIALNYTLPVGTTASDYSWGVASATSGGASGTMAIDANGHISGATSSGTAEITITAQAANKKYSGTMRTADFAIAKQTVAANTLTVANLVAVYNTGNKTVSAADVLGQLTTSGSAQSDWTVKSLADTDDHGKLAVASGGKALTISGDITNGTTVTVVFESTKYTDITKTFELSTKSSQISSATRTGSGKWGVGQTYTTDYKLVTNVGGQPFTTGASGHFTFSIVASHSGFTPTTAGIVANGQTAINSKTGAIDASKLTKSGTLLVKIVRAARGSVAETTEYQNFTVNKQVLGTGGDITTAPTSTVSINNNAWRTGGGNVPVQFGGFPAGTDFDSYDWTIGGNDQPDAISGGLKVTSAGVSGAISSGFVVLTMKAKANNPKYTGQFTLNGFSIDKQTITSPLRIRNIIKPYASGGNHVQIGAEILTNMSVISGATKVSDWTLLRLTENHANLTLNRDKKSLTITGEITAGANVTAEFSNRKYKNITVPFKVFTQNAGMYTSVPTGSGKWGQTYTTNYNLNTHSGTYNTNTDYVFSIVNTGPVGFTPTTSGIVNGALTGAVNSTTGVIDGSKLTKSGTLLVKIERKAGSNGGFPLTVYRNFIVDKQELGADVTTRPRIVLSISSAEDHKWKTNPNAKIDLKYSDLPDGLSPDTFDWEVKGKTGDAPSGTLKIDANGDISGATSGGKVVIKVKAKSSDEKYTGLFELADLTIYKQKTTDTLVMSDLKVPYGSGTVSVSGANILSGLSASGGQTKASEWKILGLSKLDNVANLVISGDKKSLRITGAITNNPRVQVTFAHPSYEAVPLRFNLSTGSDFISSGIRTGSGKWGAGQTYSTDYKLKTSGDFGGSTVSFDKATDFTFSIVSSGTTVKGFTPTTGGIALKGAIDSTTGAIDASKLTKSGTLLVKIVRKQKTGAPKLTEYQNFVVDKQTQADHPDFKVTAAAITWGAAAQSVTYTRKNPPAGISNSAQYSLIKSGTTAGTSMGSGYGTVQVIKSNGKISGTKASGVVKIRVVYPANDKYEAMTLNTQADVKRQPSPGNFVPAGNFAALDVAAIGFYPPNNIGFRLEGYTKASQPWGNTFTFKIYGKMPQTQDGIDLYTPKYTIKSRTNNGTTSVGGTINPATGEITGTTSSGTITVTVELPQNVRYERFGSKDFTVTVTRQAQTATPNVKATGSNTWIQDKWSTTSTRPLSVLPNGARQLHTITSSVVRVKGSPAVLLKIEDYDDGLQDGAVLGQDYTLYDGVPTVTTKDQAAIDFKQGYKVYIARGVRSSDIVKDRAIRLRFTFSSTKDGKYASKTVYAYWRTNK